MLPEQAPCITDNDVADYSRVVSLRMSAELLAELKARARAEGRSVSGQIVYLVREQVDSRPPSGPPKKISGWLAHRAVPQTHAEFRRARAHASARLADAVQRKASKPRG